MHVAAIGAACGAGIGIAPIGAAVRGTVNAIAAEPNFPCRSDGAPMQLVAAEPLDIYAPCINRLLWLTEHAIAPLAPMLARMSDVGENRPVLPVFLSLPPLRPGLPNEAAPRVAERIADLLPIAVDRRRNGMVRTGQDGALAAVRRVAPLLATDRPAAALIGGIDSWISLASLHWLEAQGRLKRTDAPNGLVPGEAAAFLLMANDALARALRVRPIATVRATGSGYEPDPWYAGRPCFARGLTDAIRSIVVRPANIVRTDITFADLNGEAWRAEEWSFAYLRTTTFHSEPLNLWHPADTWGDTGAAAGAMLLALAAYELARDRNLRQALVCCSSDVTPFRAAALLASVEGDGR